MLGGSTNGAAFEVLPPAYLFLSCEGIQEIAPLALAERQKAGGIHHVYTEVAALEHRKEQADCCSSNLQRDFK